MSALTPAAVCDAIVDHRATALLLLLLVGHPEPDVPIVTSVRRDQHLAEILIGAPAGRPEFAERATLLGDDGAAIPFLRYLPECLSLLGAWVETALRRQLAEAPCFVAFEGYDTVTVLAGALRSHGTDRARTAESWRRVGFEGTRGKIRLGAQMRGAGCQSGRTVESRRLRAGGGAVTEGQYRSPELGLTPTRAPVSAWLWDVVSDSR